MIRKYCYRQRNNDVCWTHIKVPRSFSVHCNFHVVLFKEIILTKNDRLVENRSSRPLILYDNHRTWTHCNIDARLNFVPDFLTVAMDFLQKNK